MEHKSALPFLVAAALSARVAEGKREARWALKRKRVECRHNHMQGLAKARRRKARKVAKASRRRNRT